MLLLFLLICQCATVYGEKSKIAIVGGGIGGTSVAYKLTELALDNSFEIEIDLYEAGEVGGRLATTVINGMEFETGGSIIHTSNRYMDTYVNKLKLTKRNEKENLVKSNNVIGLYDGKEFVYVSSQYSLVSMVKLWWRYGVDPFKLNHNVLNPFLITFERIYELQEKNVTFSDVHSLLEALNPEFVRCLNITIKDFLLTHGFHELFVNELAFIATNVNYNQDLNIHAFVGALALAGFSSDKLWSVQEGNKRVPEELLAHSDARLVKKTVKTVVLLPNSKYALEVGDKEDDDPESYTYVYDYVIIATPITQDSKNNIEFRGFPSPVLPNTRLKKTVATLVHGLLNYTYFNYDGTGKYAPDNIFPLTKDIFFSSISVVHPVKPEEQYDGKVFKIFSNEILTQTQLDLLFLNYDNVSSTEWFAYPIYSTLENNLPFELHDNLFYVNAIEWAGSAMEMSALSSVNSALLVMDKIRSHSN